MIINVRANNFYIFSEEVKLSLLADMRGKRLINNVNEKNKFNILKSVGIFGTNNSGKTSLIKSIKAIKNILLNNPNDIMPNIISRNPTVELGIRFSHDNNIYDYSFKYNIIKKEYVYENFSEIIKTDNSYVKEKIILLRDIENNLYESDDEMLKNYLHIISKDNISIYQIDPKISNSIYMAKNILTSFANKIEVVDMNNIPIKKTIDIMKNNSESKKEVVDFIKNADLNLDDFKYINDDELDILVETIDGKPAENALNIDESIIEPFKLVSVYNGVSIPSIFFDSTGTKKIASLASYIIEALKEGKILVIDELDSSLHFSLTRSIVALFNNILNENSQLIFTAHDISLMDCNKLMRKEQLWFMHKDKDQSYLYSLSEFKAKDGVRDTSDIIEKYKKGLFGAVPEPSLINSLIKITGGM